MRIGIDIDDTLTDIKDRLNIAAYEYAKSLNKKIDNKYVPVNDKFNNGNAFQTKFGFTYEELKQFLGPIQEKITDNAIPRPHCAQIIKKLHEEGNEIIIITARDDEFHKDPYNQSEKWLKKNKIYYDKLVVNARDKGKACQENTIDIFIDDNINNCKNVLNVGTQVLTIGHKQKYIEGIQNFDDWQQIYEYLSSIKQDSIDK